MSTTLELRTETLGPLLILRLSGKIASGGDVDEIHDAIDGLMSAVDSTKNVVLEMKGVERLDSRGIGAISMAYTQVVIEQKGTLVIVDASKQIKRMLRLTHLDRIVEIVDTLSDAIATV